MNRAQEIKTLEREIKEKRQRLTELRNGRADITEAHAMQIVKETPSVEELRKSWQNIYTAHDSGNPKKLNMAIDAHAELFGKGFRTAAISRAKEILDKRAGA